MNLYFDENYDLDYINLHCYVDRELQMDVAETFISKYLQKFECEKRPLLHLIRQNDFDCFTYWEATITSNVDYKTLEAMIRTEITQLGSTYDIQDREITIENIENNIVQIGVQGCWGWPESGEPDLMMTINNLEGIEDIK